MTAACRAKLVPTFANQTPDLESKICNKNLLLDARQKHLIIKANDVNSGFLVM
jgi:hypothetical protein